MTPDQTIDAATEVAAEEWVKFQVDMPANLNLRDQVTFFGSRVQKVLLTSFPDLRAANEQILLLIVARGIELSGSIPKPRIERELGIVLPPRPSLLSTRSGHSP
ncbi:MAG: hypothetical protein LH465_00540 [Sphingomonas bacterium]|nr:hypothetical protein [Sphingomonas bacterium]